MRTAISAALATAIQHHQAGRLQAAEQIYREILALQPDHAEAIHLLGVIAHQAGRHEEAVQYIRRAIGLDGSSAAFHVNLGNALKDLGKLDEAIACYRRALELKPDFVAAHNNLGNALREQGRLDEAIACHRRALELKPDHAGAQNNLAAALKEQGKLEEAIACWRRALELQPNLAEAHNNLGAACKDQGRLDEAIACYRRALELKPDFAEAHNNLGVALTQQGEIDEAVACCRRAVELKPAAAEVHNSLGNALKGQGKLDEAAGCYRRALELQPDYAEAHNNLGAVFKDQGRLEEAVACCRRALELQPDYAEAHCNLGASLSEEGKLDEAIKCCREAITCAQRRLQANPGSAAGHDVLGKALGQLALFSASRLGENDLMAMRELLAEADLRGDSRTAVQFGLARALDAAGNYAEAAAHLQEANAMRLAQLRARDQQYQPAGHRHFVDALIAASPAPWFARTKGFGLDTELPVFIFGLPRSGTSLVEQILASHSQVFGAGELPDCREMFERLPQAMLRKGTPLECLHEMDEETARKLARRHVDRLQALGKGALRVVDKLPDNYHFLGLIRMLFPRARLIHCRRDLRDVALSCWMTDFAGIAWAYDPEHIACHFQQYLRVMDHWRRVLPAPWLDVDYEETVEDLEGVARRIVQWCGLPWEASCLRFHETQRPVRTASAIQVRRPIYRSSVGRWKNYEAWLGELFVRVHDLDERFLGACPDTTPRSP